MGVEIRSQRRSYELIQVIVLPSYVSMGETHIFAANIFVTPLQIYAYTRATWRPIPRTASYTGSFLNAMRTTIYDLSRDSLLHGIMKKKTCVIS